MFGGQSFILLWDKMMSNHLLHTIRRPNVSMERLQISTIGKICVSKGEDGLKGFFNKDDMLTQVIKEPLKEIV